MSKRTYDISQVKIMVGGVEIKGGFCTEDDLIVDFRAGRLELTDEEWRIIAEATAPPGMRYAGRERVLG